MKKALFLILIFLFVLTPAINIFAAGTNYRYTGQELDPTGLYYYGQRYYDPNTGRFTQPDPLQNYLTDPQKLKQTTGQDLQKFLENPQNLNPYSYVQNNPVKYVDPTGEQAVPVQWVAPVVSAVEVVIVAGAATVAYQLMPAAQEFLSNTIIGAYEMAKTIISTILLARSQHDTIEKIRQQEKPIQEHLDKLNNPNEPGGKNPNTRNTWREHIEKALNKMKEYAEKLKVKAVRERELERIEKIREEVKNIPVYIEQPQVDNQNKKDNQN